jgi:renalase
MVKVAIVGAGFAGLSLANMLKGRAEVVLFEKSRGYGGRIATRYADKFSFDHGAQFFSVRTESFKNFLKPLIDDGAVTQWHANFAEIDHSGIIRNTKWGGDYPHYVGYPAMNAMGKYLANDLNIKLNTKVAKIEKKSQWVLYDDENNFLGEFDWVIVTAPAAQTYDLIPDCFVNKNLIADVQMSSCFSLMLGFNEVLDLDFDAALVKNYDISWISVNSSKPGRNDNCSLLVHSTNKWASEHIDDDRQYVKDYLTNITSDVISKDLSHADHIGLQAWRYANIKKHSVQFDIDTTNKLAVCGDWCIKGRIESAYTSARKVYSQIVSYL